MKLQKNKWIMATALLTIGMVGWSPQQANAQHYTNGQVGTFGITAADSSAWTDGAGLGTFNTANQYDTRFTALENITVDRVFQRITGLEPSGSLTVEIHNDNGSGLPGSLMASATVTPSTAIQSVVFGSTSLTSGNVYHVVYKTSTGGGLFRFGGADTGIRPYDLAVDNKMTVLRSNDSGGSWSDQLAEPYFWFANGSDTGTVSGPGQPYSGFSTPSNRNVVQGGGGGKAGQEFTITDKEIPFGKSVAFYRFNLTAQVNASASNNNLNLIARFRDLNNNILASATITPSQADGTEKTYTLDNQIELKQGVPYVLTFELSSVGVNADDYLLRQNLTDGLSTDESGASWGGKNIAFPVNNQGGNTWLSSYFVPQNDNFNDQADIVFSFQGVVVPEPATTSLLVLGVSAILWRRRR